MDDEVTEFETIDPDEIHLVGTPASKFAALMAKSTEKGKKVKKMKKSEILKQLKQLEKAAAQQAYPSVSRPSVTGIDLAGSGSTIGNSGAAQRIVSSFLGGFEDRVDKARGDVAVAESSGSAMQQDRARSTLRTALRQRLLAKLVIKENVAKSAGAPGPFGAPIFASGSTYELGDDDGLGYVGHGGQAVR